MTYDANGNTLNDGTNSYVWDARNRLVSADNNGASFSYDPLGRRTAKTLLSSATGFVYDGANPVQEQSGGAVTANLLTGGVDEYYLRMDTTGTYSYLTDALGSTVALTDSTGASVEQYSYGPYGILSSNGNDSNSYTYTGRESDGLGIDYYRARYYSPSTGRFLSEDPLGFDGGDVNLYVYTGDSPTNFIDPSGLTTESNAIYLAEWALGLGQTNRSYGPNDTETQELQNSPGVEQMRQQFEQNGEQTTTNMSYGTFQAYWDTTVNPFTADWSNTAAEVGGWGGASVTNNGDGTATYYIPNTSGTHSFFLHLVPDRQSPTGPMRNIYQKFQWTEPIRGRQCGHYRYGK
jgi:RHS repeat-associated protein